MIEDKNITIARVCNIHAVTSRNVFAFANKEGFTVVRATKLQSGMINYWLQKKSDTPEQDMAAMTVFFQPGEIIHKFTE